MINAIKAGVMNGPAFLPPPSEPGIRGERNEKIIPGIRGEDEGNSDYGGKVQSNQQHVAPCV